MSSKVTINNHTITLPAGYEVDMSKLSSDECEYSFEDLQLDLVLENIPFKPKDGHITVKRVSIYPRGIKRSRWFDRDPYKEHDFILEDPRRKSRLKLRRMKKDELIAWLRDYCYHDRLVWQRGGNP